MFRYLKKIFNKFKKSSNDSWAENEVRLALEKEKASGDDISYSKMCYSSALEAYSVLNKKGHSGLSISLTQFILNRLIDRKPLSTITDKDFEGVEPIEKVFDSKSNDKTYQCPRYSALFKKEDPSGVITYSDNNRVETIDRNGAICFCGYVTKMIDERFPLTLPYYPGKPYKVYTAEFTYHSEDGSVTIDPGFYNAMLISYMITPDGKKVTLNTWYFEEDLAFTPVALEGIKKELINSLVENGLPVLIDS